MSTRQRKLVRAYVTSYDLCGINVPVFVTNDKKFCDKLLGEYVEATMDITLAVGMRNSVAESTLIHELMHAVFDRAGLTMSERNVQILELVLANSDVINVKAGPIDNFLQNYNDACKDLEEGKGFLQ